MIPYSYQLVTSRGMNFFLIFRYLKFKGFYLLRNRRNRPKQIEPFSLWSRLIFAKSSPFRFWIYLHQKIIHKFLILFKSKFFRLPWFVCINKHHDSQKKVRQNAIIFSLHSYICIAFLEKNFQVFLRVFYLFCASALLWQFFTGVLHP